MSAIHRLSRQQLYERVWNRPMTALAREFHLSDSGLRNVCLKHRIPTPRSGYWMKKAHGKPVKPAPLPDPEDDAPVIIYGGASAGDTVAMAAARADTMAAIETAAETTAQTNRIVEKTIAKLRTGRPNRDGLVCTGSHGLVRVSVRPDCVERAGALLEKLVAAGELVGMKLLKADSGAAWRCGDESIEFELTEAADQVEHVATAKELAAVEKWKREREEDFRRYNYWRNWGEPKIPKWEQRYQGRLQVKLEEVRVRTERSWWGEPIRRTFSETRRRALDGSVPKIIATIAAMAAAKRSNTEFEQRRRLAELEAARAREEQQRRRLLEQRAVELFEKLNAETSEADRLRKMIDRSNQTQLGERGRAFLSWMEARLEALEQQLEGQIFERRLAAAELFGPEEGPEHPRGV